MLELLTLHCKACAGIVKRSGALLGVTLATSFVARWHGVAHCLKDERFERGELFKAQIRT